MQNKQLFIIVSIVLCVCPSLKGQTIEWAINPQYDSLEYIDENHLMYSVNSKYGVVSLTGTVNVPADYDKLIMHKDGTILAVNYEAGNRIRLNALIDKNSLLVTQIKSTYYLTPYSFFSEEKMCIQDNKGKVGFIDRSGNLVIRCRFDHALPFANGRAAVKIGREHGYVTSSGAPIRMNGTFTDAFSFHNGEAVVFKLNGHDSKSRDGLVINTEGGVLRDWKMSVDETRRLAESRADYSVNGSTEAYLYQYTDSRSGDVGYALVSENGNYGYTKNGSTWVIPQFSQAFPFINKLAIVKKEGKWGVLRQVNGNFSVSIEKEAIELKKEDSYVATFFLNVPERWQDKSLLVQMAANSASEYKTMSMVENKGSILKFEYPINVKDKPSSFDFRWKISADGLLLAENLLNHLSLTYRKAEADILVSTPRLVEERADSNHSQTISVNVVNRGEEEVNLQVTFRVDGYNLAPNGTTINLQPGQARKVETKASDILDDTTKHVTVVVSGGAVNKIVSDDLLFKSHYQ